MFKFGYTVFLLIYFMPLQVFPQVKSKNFSIHPVLKIKAIEKKNPETLCKKNTKKYVLNWYHIQMPASQFNHHQS